MQAALIHCFGSNMLWFRQSIILILISLFSFTVFSAELIPHKAIYTAKIKKGISINGEAVRELIKLDNGQWLYRFDVESFVADIKESSLLEWHNDHIIPQKYQYKLSAFLARDRKQEVLFNWEKHQAHSVYKKNKWTIKSVPDLTLDRLSYQLQILMDVNAGKRDMVYQIAHKDEIQEMHFRVIREEKIETALGMMDSYVLEKVRLPSKKRQTHLWFAKDHAFLLLKMTQIEKDGEEYEINLKSAELNGVPVKNSSR